MSEALTLVHSTAGPLNGSGHEPVDLKVFVIAAPIEEKTAGGIWKPDTTAEREKYAGMRGTLVARGPNAFKEWGDDNGPMPGERVLFAQYAGKTFKGDDGKDYIVMNDEDVIGRAAR